MAMKRSFYTIDGAIVGEQTSSGRINYATDALGSVTGTLVGSQLVNTYAYKPYGALLASTGSGTTPKQQWVGNTGYRPTSRAQSDYYVRARHYGSAPGIWTTVDPLWPVEPAYNYASSGPVSATDMLGLILTPALIGAASVKTPPDWRLGRFCTCETNTDYLFEGYTGRVLIDNLKSVPYRYQACAESACERYCARTKPADRVDDCHLAADITGDFFSHIEILNNKYDACTKGNPYWEECARTVVQATNTKANCSNWPKPACQLDPIPSQIGWDMCAQECRIRVCCANMAKAAAAHDAFLKDLHDCWYNANYGWAFD
jgi:RHS repeat-associated protein